MNLQIGFNSLLLTSFLWNTTKIYVSVNSPYQLLKKYRKTHQSKLKSYKTSIAVIFTLQFTLLKNHTHQKPFANFAQRKLFRTENLFLFDWSFIATLGNFFKNSNMQIVLHKLSSSEKLKATKKKWKNARYRKNCLEAKKVLEKLST